MVPRILCESCCCSLPSSYAKPKLVQFASKCCLECKSYMCPDCIASSYHPAHHFVDLPESQCPFHPGKPLDMYCIEHGTPCCSECVHEDKHSACQVVAVHGTQEIQPPKTLVEAGQKAEDALDSLQKMYDEMSQKKGELLNQIRGFFDRVKAEICSREVKLLTDVERCWEEKYDCSDIIQQASERVEHARSIIGSENRNAQQSHTEMDTLARVLKDICDKTEQVAKRPFELEFASNFEDIKTKIETLGSVGYRCRFKPCPSVIAANKKYVVSGRDGGEIATKVEVHGCWSAVIGDTAIPMIGRKITRWAFKPVNIKDGLMMVGVAPASIDLNEDLPHMTCGWYFYCKDASLYSNPYARQRTLKYKKWSDAVKVSNEVGVVVDAENRTISFVVANECLGPSYVDIPIDKPLVPAVCLYGINDSVEILTTI